MRKLLIIAGLLFSIASQAQVGELFGGTANVFAVDDNTGPQFIFRAFFNEAASRWTGDSTQVGDHVFVFSGNKVYRLTVDSILAESAALVTLRVRDSTATLASFPTGVCALMRLTDNNMYPATIPGLPNVLYSKILTYFAEQADNASGSSGVYSLSSPTTLTVGGINSGTAIVGLSLEEIIEDLLVPYIPPTFATFLISGQSTAIEVGDSITGSKDFTWTFTNGSNVTATTTDIADLTTPATLYTNISNTPPQAHNFTPSIRKTTATSHSWRGSATNTQSTAFNSSSFTVAWQHKRYWGWCPDSTPSDAEILAVSDELSTSRAKSAFTATVSGSDRHVFYAYPASFGDLTSLTVGGFESLPAFTKTTRAFINDFGVSISYNVYVSNNTFSANITNIVTQ